MCRTNAIKHLWRPPYNNHSVKNDEAIGTKTGAKTEK